MTRQTGSEDELSFSFVDEFTIIYCGLAQTMAAREDLGTLIGVLSIEF
jgi:hypothetical protein